MAYKKESLRLNRFTPPLKPGEVVPTVSAFVGNQLTRFPGNKVFIVDGDRISVFRSSEEAAIHPGQNT